MNRRSIFLIYLFLPGILLLAACESSPTEFERDTAPLLEEQAFGEATISRKTKVLADSTLALLASVSDDGTTFTFNQMNATLSSLSPGDILISGVSTLTPNGVLRKVSRLESQGSSVRVLTTTATLEEGLVNASIELSQVLSPDNISAGKALVPGVSSTRRAGKNNHAAFALDMYNVVVYDGDDNEETTNDQIRASGRIDFEPAFTFKLSVSDGHLEELSYSVSNTLTAEINLDATLDLVNFEGDIEIFRWNVSPITVWAGFVPIVITPTLAVHVGAHGQVSIGMSTGATATATLTAGVTYSNRRWTPLSDLTTGFQFRSPTVSATANAEAYAAPHISFLVYGIAGPYANIKGYSEFNADINANPWWQLFGGIKVDVGVFIDIFSQRIAEYSQPDLIDYKRLLAEAQNSFNRPGTLSGSVRDAASRTALAGVSVQVYNGNLIMAEGLTESDGAYTIQIPPHLGYRVQFSRTGYLTTSYENVDVLADQTTFLESVLQIDERHSGQGEVSGTIVNALDGQPVVGLTVRLRSGINARQGSILRSTSTDASGRYIFSNLNAGHYTAEASSSGYNTTYFTIVSLGGQTTSGQNASITPLLSSDETRIILTWGESPRDLDSHLTGPLPNGSRFHVYYANRIVNQYANLDLDDTDGFGPETVTLFQEINGLYRYSVHDFTNSNSISSDFLSKSGAIVRVYRGNDLVATFNVPPNQPGTLWTVFEMNSGVITPINDMSFESLSSEVRKNSNSYDGDIILKIPPK